MSKKRGPTAKREWQSMQRAVAFRSEAKTQALKRLVGDDNSLVERLPETWMNDRYVVTVDRYESGDVMTLSIRRQDRGWPRDWRDFQRIKNEIAGDDAEAVELYPAEDRLVDTANQFWLWCTPRGERFPIGFDEGRMTSNDDLANQVGAKQRDHESEPS